jgi:glycosyltransferase involved in cell wall biosynthesis
VKPGVSILMAAYNSARYVREAVDSALAQADAKVELIVVDDGSADDTPSILRSYGAGITFIEGPHRGAAAARNAAWKASTSEFIAILDADDRLSPGAFGPKLALLASHPSAGVAYGDALAIDENGQPLRPIPCRRHLTDADDPLDVLLERNLFAPHAALARRSALERLPYLHHEQLELVADWDLWIRVAEVTPFAYAGDMSAEYRQHPAMFTRNLARDEGLRQTLNTLRRALELPGAERVSPRVRAAALRQMLFLALRLRSEEDVQSVGRLWSRTSHRPLLDRVQLQLASMPGAAPVAGWAINTALAARRRVIGRNTG